MEELVTNRVYLSYSDSMSGYRLVTKQSNIVGPNPTMNDIVYASGFFNISNFKHIRKHYLDAVVFTDQLEDIRNNPKIEIPECFLEELSLEFDNNSDLIVCYHNNGIVKSDIIAKNIQDSFVTLHVKWKEFNRFIIKNIPEILI